jgi:hypothetical protein
VLVPPAALAVGLSQAAGGGGSTPRRRLVASTTGLTTGSSSSSQAPALLGSTGRRGPEASQAVAPADHGQQHQGAPGAKPAAAPGLRGCGSLQEVVAACQLLRSYSHLITLPELQPARTLAPPVQRLGSSSEAQRASACASASEVPADAGPSSPAAAPAGAPTGGGEQQEQGQEEAQLQVPTPPLLVRLLGSSTHASAAASASATGAATGDAKAPAGIDAPMGPSGSKPSVQGAGSHVQAVALIYQYRAGNVGGLQLHTRGQRTPGSSAFPSPRGFGGAGRAGAGVSVLAQVLHHVRQHDALQMAQLRERLLAARRLPAPPPAAAV